MDLDGNGEADDVDGIASNANLQQAVTSWAGDADSLVIYLVDHGGMGSFRMSATETLTADDLAGWLATLQDKDNPNGMHGQVVVVYDACESGSFLSALAPTASEDRIVITSTSIGESAHFVTQGSISPSGTS